MPTHCSLHELHGLRCRDASFQSVQTTIKPRGRGAQYILWNIATLNWRPSPCCRHLAAINLTPLTLRVPIRTLRPMVIVVSQKPRVYCYLYSGNYQFAGIHYGIRDGFDDLEAPVCSARRNTRQRELRATCVMHLCTSGWRIAFSRRTNGQ